MYLKEIEIIGFKSFATKTNLSFLPPQKKRQSITAIVGPNGSGKSNVSDAIRWVMGEQRIKQLRGKKSEDIIFSGSESKGKMGMASVTMTLDNSDNRAAVDYDELVVSRRIYRSGESEYLINGQQVRLIDLHILLAKAQFGHGSYSVIGQGMIDKLILQSPEDRKSFFDEAAGIKEFQIKRHQATLKLNRTRVHIDQATLILNELSPRLKALSRQVKKLEERQDLEIELRESQEVYYLTMWNHHGRQIDKIKGELEGIEKQYRQSNDKLTSIQEELASIAKEASRQEVFQSLQKEYQQILQEKNNLERNKAVMQGKMQTEYSKVGKQNVGWLEQKITELKQQQIKLEETLKEQNKNYDNLQTLFTTKNAQIETLGFRRTELRGNISRLEQQLLHAKSEQSISQFTGMRAVQSVLENSHQFDGVFGAVAQLGKVESSYQLAMDVAAGGNISSIVVKNDEVAQSCIEFLRKHQHGFATFLPINKIKPRYISEDVERYIGMPGVHGFAVDLIDFEEKFNNIFSYIFGASLIVENIDIARKVGVGRVRMVTLSGDVLETSGSMKGGYRKSGSYNKLSFSQRDGYSANNNIERTEDEIINSQKELEQVEIKLETLQQEINTNSSQLQISKHTIETINSQQGQVAKEKSEFEQELSFHTMSPDEYSSALKDVAVQTQELEKTISETSVKLEIVQRKIEEFNNEEEKKKQRVFALQDAMQIEQSILNIIVTDKNKYQVELAKLETKLEDLLNELYQEMRLSIEAITSRRSETVELNQLEKVQSNIQKIKYKLSLIGGIDEEVIEDYKQTKERHDSLSMQLGDLEKAIKDLDSLIEEFDGLMKKKHKKAFAQIRKEFQRYFSILFEGGKADLLEIVGRENSNKTEDAEIDSEDQELLQEDKLNKKSKRGKKILQGIDITACPPGKKIKTLQSLSGGERTMTSIALICAILKVNPSPFVVLDEVEAALDEANTVRFTKILHELSTESQFILITHNRATMHAADALYGVTMGNEGISHLLSVKLDQAEASIE